ncbi:hypothetical protein HDK90DRAFT_515844 [Phyllosticta capitalensis]|uniref:Uncharacterized protein n=1 Tax=Phyllosticta capitalensis TaxID=121624 RepID=A0ABR1Y9T1_9PEZI
MLRRFTFRALAAPSRSFSTSSSLARRQRRPATVGRKDAPEVHKPSAAAPRKGEAKEDNDSPDGPMQLDDLEKMLNKLELGPGGGGGGGDNPLAGLDLGSLANLNHNSSSKSKSKGKSKGSSQSDAPIGDGTLRPRESELPNYLDSADPLGLKGKKPGPGMFDNNMDPIFDFYEQDMGDETGKTRRRVTHAQIAADKKTGEELEAKIARLERDLREAKRDDPLLRIQETLKAIARDELLTEPIRLLGDADPAEINAAMEELRICVPDAVRKMAVSGDELQARAALNAAQRLLHLNNALRHAFLATDEAKRPAVRAVLWKAYKTAKLGVPDLLGEIPPAAWDMLFYTQAVRWNRRREVNMAEVLQDMRTVGLEGPPTPPPDGKPIELDAVAPFRGGRRRRPGRRAA